MGIIDMEKGLAMSSSEGLKLEEEEVTSPTEGIDMKEEMETFSTEEVKKEEESAPPPTEIINLKEEMVKSSTWGVKIEEEPDSTDEEQTEDVKGVTRYFPSKVNGINNISKNVLCALHKISSQNENQHLAKPKGGSKKQKLKGKFLEWTNVRSGQEITMKLTMWGQYTSIGTGATKKLAQISAGEKLYEMLPEELKWGGKKWKNAKVEKLGKPFTTLQ